MDQLERYYFRYGIVILFLNKTKSLVSSKANRAIYELRNSVERLLLTRANQNPEILFVGDTGLKQFEFEIKTKFDFIEQKKIDYLIRYFHSLCLVYINESKFIGDATQIEVGKNYVQYRDYRHAIDKDRIELLLKVAEKNGSINPKLDLVSMIMCYASIIPGSQHWSASPEHYQKYHEHGITLEGFASPINSQFLSKGLSYCSLFPEVDTIFDSIGNFFTCQLLGKISIGPPFTEEMFNRITEKILSACENQEKVRFYFTHANWSDVSGYQKLSNSKYLIHKEILIKNKHFYIDTNVVPNKKIKASFDTVLFVISNYTDTENFTDILDGLKSE